MRIFDTKYLVDRHWEEVNSLYHFVADPDFNSPDQVAAILELKLYHLPPFFKTAQSTKVKLNNMVRSVDNVHQLEYDLLHGAAFATAKRFACPRCQRKKAVIEGMCQDCWNNTFMRLFAEWKARIEWTPNPPMHYFACREHYHQSAPVPGQEWFWKLEFWKDVMYLDSFAEAKHAFATLIASKRRILGLGRPSPKRALMAALIGCRKCGYRHPASVWKEAKGWMDGICPACRPDRGNWHVSPFEPLGYKECHVCKCTHEQYAMWGMCESCYRNWQDEYLNLDLLYHTAKTHGTIALLLIRTDLNWAAYLKDNLPNSFSSHRNAVNIVPFKAQARAAIINIKERVNVLTTVQASTSQEESIGT